MDQEEPEVVSRAGLARILHAQQQQIAQLEVSLRKLKKRVASLEEGARQEAAAKARQERERAVRDGLRHLDDLEYLAESRLAEIVTDLQGRASDGQNLRDALVRAIHRTKPENEPPYEQPEDRYYDVLRLTYLQRESAQEIADSIIISKRQYYRDLKAAINRVAEYLVES